MQVYNKMLKGKSIVGSFGEVEFNEEGIAEVEGETAKILLKLGNYEQVGKLKNTKESIEDTNEEIEEGEEDEEEIDLESLNVPQLKKYAREHGIYLGDASKKDEILEILRK